MCCAPTSSRTDKFITRRLGVSDIGSNTVHPLLIDAHPGASSIPFASHKLSLQRRKFVDETGAISELASVC